MNWLQAMIRKKRLRKNLNWLMRTSGMKVITLYFWFLFGMLGFILIARQGLHRHPT
jgi:hypothetical protein